MKLVCTTQAYNANSVVGHDGLTDVERFMQSIVKYCDALVFFDDGSTDGTREVVGSFGDQIEIQIPSERTNRPHLEWLHRARCLEHAKRLGGTKVLALKVDEVLEAKAERGYLRTIAECNEQVVGFQRCNLWKTDRFVRVGAGWSGQFADRLFTLSDDLKYKTDEGVGTSLLPVIEGARLGSNLKLIHYGFFTQRHIEEYIKRYRSLGVDKSQQLSESDLHLVEAHEDWFPDGFSGPNTEVYRVA